MPKGRMYLRTRPPENLKHSVRPLFGNICGHLPNGKKKTLPIAKQTGRRGGDGEEIHSRDLRGGGAISLKIRLFREL
jgi:hypothetical protein